MVLPAGVSRPTTPHDASPAAVLPFAGRLPLASRPWLSGRSSITGPAVKARWDAGRPAADGNALRLFIELLLNTFAV